MQPHLFSISCKLQSSKVQRAKGSFHLGYLLPYPYRRLVRICMDLHVSAHKFRVQANIHVCKLLVHKSLVCNLIHMHVKQSNNCSATVQMDA